MAAGAFERAGLTASVVSLSILRATAYAPNKKANPSRGKMALSYLAQVDLADTKSFQDEVDWRAAGAGRNCYFFRSYHLALKMFVDDEKRWSVHETEHVSHSVRIRSSFNIRRIFPINSSNIIFKESSNIKIKIFSQGECSI